MAFRCNSISQLPLWSRYCNLLAHYIIMCTRGSRRSQRHFWILIFKIAVNAYCYQNIYSDRDHKYKIFFKNRVVNHSRQSAVYWQSILFLRQTFKRPIDSSICHGKSNWFSLEKLDLAILSISSHRRYKIIEYLYQLVDTHLLFMLSRDIINKYTTLSCRYLVGI